VFFPAFYLFPFVFEFDGDYSESNRHPWLGPLVFAALGAVFLGIALFLARRRRDAIPAAELL
jgi:LPXTG-motif cell wall-anchored protein